MKMNSCALALIFSIGFGYSPSALAFQSPPKQYTACVKSCGLKNNDCTANCLKRIYKVDLSGHVACL